LATNLHRIYLRKPWQCEAIAEGMLWRRKFGQPNGLGRGHSVWLGVGMAWSGGSAALNGQSLGEIANLGAIAWYDVTARLSVRNELQILLSGAVPAPESPADPPGDIFLEIRSD
jgi:hypothetical protein